MSTRICFILAFVCLLPTNSQVYCSRQLSSVVAIIIWEEGLLTSNWKNYSLSDSMCATIYWVFIQSYLPMTLSQNSILSANQVSLVMTSSFPISRYLWSSASTGSHVIPAGEPVEVGHFLHPTFFSEKKVLQLLTPGGVGSPSLAKFPHMLLIAREVNQFNSDQVL